VVGRLVMGENMPVWFCERLVHLSALREVRRTIENLLRISSSDTFDPLLRARALWSSGDLLGLDRDLPDPRHVELVEVLAKESTTGPIRIAGIRALGLLHRDRHRQLIEACRFEDDPSVRRMARWALRRYEEDPFAYSSLFGLGVGRQERSG
jgi:hypothetical protein